MKLHEMLDALTAREKSERRAAALFGISQSSFNAWRRRRALPDDEQAARLAELLQLDPAFVLAVIHGERAKSQQIRETWQRVADAFGKAAMLAVITATPFLLPSPTEAGTLHKRNLPDATRAEYTLRDKRRRWLATLTSR